MTAAVTPPAGLTPPVCNGDGVHSDLVKYGQRVARRCANTPGRGHHLTGGDGVAERICSVPGCGTPVYGRGWCGRHYQIWRKHGDLRDRKPGPVPKGLEERFWAKVNKHGPIPAHRPDLGPCWIWLAHKNEQGYGRMYGHPPTGRIYAHRYAYELLVGPIPEDLTLDHMCHNTDPSCAGGDGCPHRACCNPAHLEPATQRENNLRGHGLTATKSQQTHCIYGHPFDLLNTYYARNGTRRCRACHRERRKGDAMSAEKMTCPRCGREIGVRLVRGPRVNAGKPIPAIRVPVRHRRPLVRDQFGVIQTADWCEPVRSRR